MFDNISGKIKNLAGFICWAGIIISVISGIIMFFHAVIYGFCIIIGGCLGSWISSLLLYGYGQMIENSDIIASQTYHINEELTSKKREADKQNSGDIKIQSTDSFEKTYIDNVDNFNIQSVDNKDNYIDISCPNCEAKLSFLKEDLFDKKTLRCPFCEKKFESIDLTI